MTVPRDCIRLPSAVRTLDRFFEHSIPHFRKYKSDPFPITVTFAPLSKSPMILTPNISSVRTVIIIKSMNQWANTRGARVPFTDFREDAARWYDWFLLILLGLLRYRYRFLAANNLCNCLKYYPKIHNGNRILGWFRPGIGKTDDLPCRSWNKW